MVLERMPDKPAAKTLLVAPRSFVLRITLKDALFLCRFGAGCRDLVPVLLSSTLWLCARASAVREV